jgi:hypothetical protein
MQGVKLTIIDTELHAWTHHPPEGAKVVIDNIVEHERVVRLEIYMVLNRREVRAASELKQSVLHCNRFLSILLDLQSK